MNPSNLVVTQHSRLNGESMQMLARWLQRNNDEPRPRDERRRQISERYPLGLLSDAELDALLCVFSDR